MYINSNITAINAHRNLKINNEQKAKTMEKLSTGYRISRAADDAAGLAISEKMKYQINGTQQAMRNVQDGISLIQTAEGGMNEIHAMLQRMNTLANQSSNGTYSNDDRAKLDLEFQQLKKEIGGVAEYTNFNGINLLNRSEIQNDGSSNLKYVEWENVDTPVSGNFKHAIYDGNKYIAVTHLGEIVTSVDGEIWNESTSPVSVSLEKVYWDGNKYFAVGEGQTILYSTDAEVWNVGITGGSHYFYDISSNGAVYFATGNAGRAYSTDGENWTYWDPNLNQASSELFTIGSDFIWVQASTVKRSSDGVNWNDLSTLNSSINSIAWNGNTFVAVGDFGKIYTSNDLLSWDDHSLVNGNNLKNIYWDGTRYVASATVYNSNSSEMIFSSDGINWDTLGVLDLNFGNTILQTDEADTYLMFGSNGEIKKGSLNADTIIIPNGKALGDIYIKKGYEPDDTLVLDMPDVTATTIGIANLSISSITDALNSISSISNALNQVSSERAKLGAYQNRLEHTLNNLQNSAENLFAAHSRIRDADMAQEMTMLTKSQIIADAGTSMLAQANALPHNILKLLNT